MKGKNIEKIISLAQVGINIKVARTHVNFACKTTSELKEPTQHQITENCFLTGFVMALIQLNVYIKLQCLNFRFLILSNFDFDRMKKKKVYCLIFIFGGQGRGVFVCLFCFFFFSGWASLTFLITLAGIVVYLSNLKFIRNAAKFTSIQKMQPIHVNNIKRHKKQLCFP